MTEKKADPAAEVETRKHIARVAAILHLFARKLLDRADAHDQTKLGSPEIEVLSESTSKLRGLTYMSDEYNKQLETVDMKPFLDHHYAKNRHHPEFHTQERQWMHIVGYEGHYEVSNFGELRSVARTVERPGKGDVVSKAAKLLKPHVTPKGYERIQLTLNGVKKNHLVHRLVAEVFLDRPKISDAQINHKNGDKRDNRVANLEWMSQSDNMHHAYSTGLKSACVRHVVHCVEEDITTFGIEKMVSALISRGHKANSGGIWKCIAGDYTQHAGLHFTSENVEEYRARNYGGVNDMTLIDLVEMLCDWKAASERHDDGNILKSIEANRKRFGVEGQLAEVLVNTVKALALVE